ncbi:UNVERIFIED_CONTAM: hypothetical protein Sindi_1251700 [Sesamum indicum]
MRSGSSSRRIGLVRASIRSPPRVRRTRCRTLRCLRLCTREGVFLSRHAQEEVGDGARSTTQVDEIIRAVLEEERARRLEWAEGDVPKDGGVSSGPAHGQRPQCPRQVRGFDGNDEAVDVCWLQSGARIRAEYSALGLRLASLATPSHRHRHRQTQP